MSELQNLEKLPHKAAEKLRVYLEDLLKVHKDNIVSIFVYGSTASGDHIPGISVINSVIVFKQLEVASFKNSLRIVNRGIRNGIAAPLFFTPEHIRTSTDTFPIEFLEMKENHLLVYGEDILKDLQIDPSHIRFICEEQLKGKLIRIRQAYLEIGLRKKGMEALVKESLDSLFPVFRGLLRLKDIAPPIEKEKTVELLSEAFGIDGAVFSAVLKDTKNDEKVDGQDIEVFLERYVNQIQKLADISDKL
ncbi:MAG: hypothetical protein HQ558_01050 [Candidatus Omnitrophica bacterium]|nr:hypothetical protein [Candidatus Omnitrophota bacterium]